MTQVSLEDAEKQFRRLIEAAQNGEEIVITQDHEPLARLVGVERPAARPRFGFARGVITYMADDFDAPLEDFREYM